LHRNLFDQHFCVEGRKTWSEPIEMMQTALETYLAGNNTKRPRQDRGMNGRTLTKTQFAVMFGERFITE
jgi:hypothetical protein